MRLILPRRRVQRSSAWVGWGVVFLLVLSSCAPADACARLEQDAPAVSVLFIGNSYTYVNDLPGTFRQLGCTGGYRVEVAQEASGGWTLAQHAASEKTLAAIQSRKWDYVVLQEQSEIPATYQVRDQSMYPAVRQLVHSIRGQGSKPILYLTWGHRQGSEYSGQSDFGAMQEALNRGYLAIAQELALPLVPVGPAWQQALVRPNAPDLWQGDGSHPSANGTYLAACVFYAALFQKSPVGLDYLSGLSQENAGLLQGVAAATVFTEGWR